MALAAVKTFVTGEVLYAADLNALDTNIRNNALSLISPLTGSLDAGGYDITAIDELGLSDATANASAAGRLRRNGANLTWHDGTAAINVARGVGIAAWAFVTLAAGTPTVTKHVNVTSVTDNAAADFTLTWDRDFTNATYVWGGVAAQAGRTVVVAGDTFAQAAGSLRYRTGDIDGGYQDFTHVVFAMGDI